MMTDPAASRPGTHLDPDQMADLFEGLLDTAAADGARAHLASCPECSADFAIISGQADLGELLPPVPIPPDVVARIEAALYREPPLGTGRAAGAQGAQDAQSALGAHGAPAASGHTATAVRPRRRRFRIALGALAGASLVIAGGFGLVTALNNANSTYKSSDRSVAPDGAPSSQSADGSRNGGSAPGRVMSPQAGSAGPTATGASPFKSLSLEQQAEALLGQHLTTPAAGTTANTGIQCRPAGLAGDTKPLALTQTQYQGKTVWLLIYAKPGSTTLADVYVVDADSCTSGNSGQVVDEFEIPRS